MRNRCNPDQVLKLDKVDTEWKPPECDITVGLDGVRRAGRRVILNPAKCGLVLVEEIESRSCLSSFILFESFSNFALSFAMDE